ncbi:MAG: ankyrin repeat domain-containing protein, partial [Vicinamibacterales bacterium]
LDIPAMKLLLKYGADPNIRTAKVPERYEEGGPDPSLPDQSGLAPLPWHGPAVAPIHAASGVGYGLGFAGNTHRHVPDGWVPAVKFLVEELGADVNARDHNGYTPLHHAAARGDVALIKYLVSRGADVTAVGRTGQTTVDMANGPVQRVQPYPEAIALLESLGAINNHHCVSC